MLGDSKTHHEIWNSNLGNNAKEVLVSDQLDTMKVCQVNDDTPTLLATSSQALSQVFLAMDRKVAETLLTNYMFSFCENINILKTEKKTVAYDAPNYVYNENHFALKTFSFSERT